MHHRFLKFFVSGSLVTPWRLESQCRRQGVTRDNPSIILKASHTSKLILVSSLLFIAYPAFSKFETQVAQLKRVDPHGTKDMTLKAISIEKQKECKACHFMENNRLKVKTELAKRCVSCHSQAPHSGVLEHMGRKLSKLGIGLNGNVFCASCHRTHRAYLPGERSQSTAQKTLQDKGPLESITGVPEYLKVTKDPKRLPETLEERHKPDAMILRTCTDCHRWK